MKKIYLLLAVILFLTVKSDAQSWVTVGPGTALGNASNGVRAIAVSPYDGSIYAGGTFTGASVSYLAKYNPTTDSWQQVGTGISGPVYALKFFKGKLYIGGLFANAGGVAVNNIASVTSAGSYSSVGVGLNDQVNCLYAPSDSAYLYAAGRFNADFSNTTSLLHIAKFDLTSWSAVGNGVTAVVNCMTQYNSKFYTGTENSASPVYELNGSTWSSVSGISGGKVYAIANYGGFLYAGGDFTSPTQAASKYNGTSWATIITTLAFGTTIRSLETFGPYLFIGGTFTNVGIGGAYYIGRIDSPSIPMKAVITSNNPGSAPYAIANKDGYIYLGGNFSASGYNVIKSSITIGIDEVNDLIESSTFYPNPMTTTGTLNVKLKKHASVAHLSIIDAQGKVVVEKEITEMNNNEINFTVNRNDMAAGMYYYRLDVDGNAVSSHPFGIE